MNTMKIIGIEKVTLNIGTGKSQDQLERALKLLKIITGREPVKNITKKRIQGWGIRPGLAIGCKVTLRGKTAEEVVKRLLEARENILKENNFDNSGNISFGLAEYIDIPGMKYNPDIGTMGLQACITLQRPGFRVKRRKNQKKQIPKNHTITHEDAMQFMKEQFKAVTGEEA
jgi:large subunit ribosomal protein L5